jgi:hypothetical protein
VTALTFEQIRKWQRWCEDQPADMPLEEVVRITAGDFHELCNLALAQLAASTTRPEGP